MGHPPLLNSTCITNLTSTLTNVTSLSPSLLKSCTYTIHDESPFYRAFKIIFLILTVFTITCGACALCSGHNRNIKRLRNLPPQLLHREIEREYQKLCLVTKKMKKDWEDAGLEGRYLRVSYVDDREARIRTVTIVEDLGKVPYQVQYTGSAGARTVNQTPGAELRERGANANVNGLGATYRGVAPTQAQGQARAQQASPFVNARVGTSSVAAPAPAPATPTIPARAAVRNRNGNEQELSGYEYVNYAGPPPPPYKQHQWQSIV
ncbi:hypothetical protein DL98DRAFT_626497 [Cadophora sp. DSE1049]|nr:hypothetical protein DL98DRAFT_626497 [Cadophora sp. DSE1049]